LATRERYPLTAEQRTMEEGEAKARAATEWTVVKAADVEQTEVFQAVDEEDGDGWYDVADDKAPGQQAVMA
jgi:hypothetical protein